MPYKFYESGDKPGYEPQAYFFRPAAFSKRILTAEARRRTERRAIHRS